MFRGRDDVSAEVKLIDLPEGDDVDTFNVTAANLGVNTASFMFGYNLGLLKKMPTMDKALYKSHGVIITEN